MAILVLTIADVDGVAIAVTCSSDVDIEKTPITPAIIVMSEILAALQEESQPVCSTKSKAH